MKTLDGKIIIVTGGSGLIGKAIVKDIEVKGGIAVNADVSVKDSWEAKTKYCDITSEESISECVEWVFDKGGGLHGLVNNAYPRTKDFGVDFDLFDADPWKVNIDWQLNSYVSFCHKAIQKMKFQGGGAIVNVTSIYGVVGNDFTIYEETNLTPPPAYSAIKGGIINFSRYLASRYGINRIRVNCVSPGGIFDNQPEKFVKAYTNKVPLKRMGNQGDIAPSISFLLSEEAKYITGHNLLVDGGWTII